MLKVARECVLDDGEVVAVMIDAADDCDVEEGQAGIDSSLLHLFA